MTIYSKSSTHFLAFWRALFPLKAVDQLGSDKIMIGQANGKVPRYQNRSDFDLSLCDTSKLNIGSGSVEFDGVTNESFTYQAEDKIITLVAVEALDLYSELGASIGFKMENGEVIIERELSKGDTHLMEVYEEPGSLTFTVSSGSANITLTTTSKSKL